MPFYEDYGPCCVCGNPGETRNLVQIEKRAPIPGTGWGCMVCELPYDGALAVVCDTCIDDPGVEARIKEVASGFLGKKARAPIDSLSDETFKHDPAKHRQWEVSLHASALAG